MPARELECVFPFLSEAQAWCKLPPPGITLSTSTGSCGGLALGGGKGPRTGHCLWSGACEAEWAAGHLCSPWEAGRCATAGPGTCLWSLLSHGVFSVDDRPVRESERRVSRLHFGSEESLDSEQSFPSVFREERYEQKKRE